jgi:hypothetical protein
VREDERGFSEWRKSGIIQLRTRMLDGTLDNDFKRWPKERQKSENAFKLAA